MFTLNCSFITLTLQFPPIFGFLKLDCEHLEDRGYCSLELKRSTVFTDGQMAFSTSERPHQSQENHGQRVLTATQYKEFVLHGEAGRTGVHIKLSLLS